MKKNKSTFYTLLALPSIILTTLIFIVPILMIILRSNCGMEDMIELVKDRYTWSLVSFTFFQAFLSALISVIIALPFAFFFSSFTFRGRSLILTLSDLAFALPSIIVVLGFVIWYGNNGVLNQILSLLCNGKFKLNILYSFPAIILAHVYLNFPVAFSILTSALTECGNEEEKSALFLGKKKLSIFFRITLLKIKGSVLSTFILIFLFCFPSFLIVMTLGGNPKYYTIEAEIYRRAFISGSISSSSLLAIFSFFLMTILLLITGYGREEKKIKRNRKILVKAKGKYAFLAFLLSLLILLFMLPPLLSILYRAFFTKTGEFTLKAWKDISRETTRGTITGLNAIILSLLTGLSSAFLATEMASMLSLAAQKRSSRFLPLISSLPMAMGSVTIGLGLGYLRSIVNIKSTFFSFILIVLAHTTLTLPFALRTIMPGAKKISPRLAYSSFTLGKGKWETYNKVEKPLLKSYKRKSFGFAFALSLGETNATLCLGLGKITTLPLLIYKMINQYNYQGASALAIILLLVSIVVFALSERGGKENAIS